MKSNQTNRFTLFPEEKVIMVTRLHWINIIAPGIIAIATMTGLWWRCTNIDFSLFNYIFQKELIPLEYQYHASLIGAVILLLLHLKAIVSIIASLLTRYYITDRRIIITSGILTVTLSEMLLSRCETVTLSQNVLERLLGSGDIMILSAGASLILNDVPEVNSFRMTILNLSTETQKH